MNDSSTTRTKGPEKPSLFEVGVISGGALSAGFLGGVWYQFRKSKFKFSLKEHHSELKFAGTAFLAGTVLFFGTFGVLTSAFMYSTGVSSFLEFSYFMKSTFQGRKIDGPSEEMKLEAKVFEGMSREQEMKHWSKKFEHYFEPDPNQVKSDPNVDISEVLKKIEQEGEDEEGKDSEC